MEFNKLNDLDIWDFRCSDAEEEFDEVMDEIDVKNISEKDIDTFIHGITLRTTSSKLYKNMSYCGPSLTNKIINKLPITIKQFRKILKVFGGTDFSTDWIKEWIKKNPNAKLTKEDKKKIINMGCLEFSQDFSNIDQKKFESFFSNESFIKENFGPVNHVNEQTYKDYGSYKYYNCSDIGELDSLLCDRHNNNNSLNENRIVEHSSTVDAARKYVVSLNSKIYKLLNDHGMKITDECINNFFKISTCPYILLRILSVGTNIINNDTLTFFSVSDFSYDKSLLRNLLSFIDKFDIIDIIKFLRNTSIIPDVLSLLDFTTFVLDEKGIVLSDKNLLEVCFVGENVSDGELMLPYLIRKYNIKVTDNTLNDAIKFNFSNLYFICIDSGLLPQRHHMYTVLLNGNDGILENMIDNKLVPDRSMIQYLIEISHSCRDLLKNNTNDLTDDDLETLDNVSCYTFSEECTFEDFLTITEQIKQGYDRNYIDSLKSDKDMLIKFFCVDKENFIKVGISIDTILQLSNGRLRKLFYYEVYLKNQLCDVEKQLVKEEKLTTIKVKKNKKTEQKN